MLQFSLETELEFDAVGAAIAIYGKNFEQDAAEEAVRIMRSNIRIVPRFAPPSAPGGFPYSRTGELPRSIEAIDTAAGYVVGPAFRQPEGKFSITGAETIAQLINDGGLLVTRRRVRRGRFSGVASVRAQYKPRPYIQLTLDILADQLPDIAKNAELN